MKKVEVNAKYNEVKEVAKVLGVKFVGVKTLDLIVAVNNKIEEDSQDSKIEKQPAKTLEDYNLEEGQIVTLNGRDKENKIILAGRQVQITQSSKVDGYVKGHLINDKTGNVQKTLIAIPVEAIMVEVEEAAV